jgi:uncharacterized membrane protein
MICPRPVQPSKNDTAARQCKRRAQLDAASGRLSLVDCGIGARHAAGSRVKLGLQPVTLWNRLRSTYWFVPSLLTVAAIALASVLVEIDRRFPDAEGWLWWAYGGGPDGARALLSAVAGSTITVVSVTFSVTVVALTVSSQHFGPRLLNNFMRDTAAQLVLGAFIGTFTYCLLVLRTVQGEGDGYSTFVPHLATTLGVVLTLVSVGALIYYIHHVSMSMQVSEIALAVANDLEQAIDRLYPDPIGSEVRDDPAEARSAPAEGVTIAGRDSGYVQVVDPERILALAREHGVAFWLSARPGDFVMEGSCLARVHPAPADAEAVAVALRRAFTVGPDRTSEQDAAFAVQQLVEVALRALSPGTNEPFTAVTCIDRLGQALAKLACRRIPRAARSDEEGNLRVVTEARSFGELLEAAFEPIARAAAGEPLVTERLLKTLRLLAQVARRPADHRAVLVQADLVLGLSTLRPDDPGRLRVEEGCRAIRSVEGLGPARGPRQPKTGPVTPPPS